MAFVGFKTEADAVSALKYFDNTFVDTSRISAGPALLSTINVHPLLPRREAREEEATTNEWAQVHSEQTVSPPPCQDSASRWSTRAPSSPARSARAPGAAIPRWDK